MTLHVCTREQKVGLAGCILLERRQRRDASEPLQQPGSAYGAACVAVPGACEGLPCFGRLCCVCDCMQALRAELKSVPVHALGVSESDAGMDAEQRRAQD